MRHLTRKQKRRRKQMRRAAAAILAMLLLLSILVIGLAAILYPASAATAETPTTQTPPTPTPETKQTALNLPAELEKVIDDTAAQYNLPADLVRAVIYTESRGQVDADNGLCYGLMQINKQYAQAFIDGAGVPNITDPANNICCGCWWLAELMQWADNDEALALMAYNLGQSKAKEYYSSGTITSYVEKVQEARGYYVQTKTN